MPHLVVREPGRVAVTVALHPGFTVGRDADCDLVVGDRHASRRHAAFEAAGAGFRVVDLGSTHGVLVNQAPAKERELADGDVVQIGHVLVVYRAADLPADGAIVQTLRSPVALPGRGGEARLLRVLHDVGRALGGGDPPDEILARVLDAVVDELGCERGVLGDAEGRHLVRGRAGDDLVVSRAVIERVVGRGESVLVDTGAEDAPATAVRAGVKSAMAAPLVGPGGVFGFLYVDDRARADRFGEPELHFLCAVAGLAASAAARAEAERRSAAVAEALRDAHPVPAILGESEPVRRVRAIIDRYAGADAAILVRGESGTGKELVAETLHARSPRAGQPFVAVNCAAIPDTLIESELFGHEKGAFTGAAKARRGKFVLAHRGTLFLDEIGDLSPAAQAKVLRAVEEGEVQPLGSEKVVRVDVRVVSATHRPLAEEVAARRFREDLYYRLSVGEIELPPLRARGEDVVLLARTFLARASARLGRPARGLSPAAPEALRAYGWPGNVRQLQNEIERAVILADGPVLDLEDLRGRTIAATPAAPPRATLAERYAELDVLERQLVVQALADAGGNVSEAARLLGVSRIVLRRRIERYGLDGADPS